MLLAISTRDLGEGEVVAFIAQVDDADGFDDILGGLVMSEDGSPIYTPFVQISEGSFEAVLSWDQIDEVQAATPGETRTFLAEFRDAAGLTASDTVDLSFTCAEGSGLCGGVCASLDTETDCGACGHMCAYGTCSDGTCPCGNGEIDFGEQCDGDDLSGFDCQSLGLGRGTLLCDPVMCSFDTSMC